MEWPERAFSRLVRSSWHFDEAVVEGQGVSGWLSFSRVHLLDDGGWKLVKLWIKILNLAFHPPSIPDLYDQLIPYWILPPYGILPPLLILSIERKQLHDESVNLGKCQHLALRVLDRHGDQRDQAGRERILRGWDEKFWGFFGDSDGMVGGSEDLFPFYRQINSSRWKGGLYSINRKCLHLSATEL